MTQSPTIGALAAALAKSQGAMKAAHKDASNPFFKSKYADLASVWEACRAALAANGLAVCQIIDGEALTTILLHSSGEWLAGTYPIKPVKNDPQGVGSAITYARRYALAAMAGVVADDDDGEAAQGRTAKVNSAGEHIKKKPSWTDAQKLKAGELKAGLMAYGEGGEEAFNTFWRDHQYDEPDTVIAVLTAELNAWKG
jgi:hypothetical protein